MPVIHVCSLARLPATVEATGASHVATLINAQTDVPRPESVAEDAHLRLLFNDIIEETEGLVAPSAAHVETLIGFARAWSRAKPMVIHCFAGISRSTAGAYISALAVDPNRDEAELAADLRRQSPSATPNIRMIRFADDLLNRRGRMVDAITAIGRGRDAFEGEPIRLSVAVSGA